MMYDTCTTGLRSWNSISATDFSKVKSFREKAWLGRSVSCPALINHTVSEVAEDSFFLGRLAQEEGERDRKKIRTSREDSYE